MKRLVRFAVGTWSGLQAVRDPKRLGDVLVALDSVIGMDDQNSEAYRRALATLTQTREGADAIASRRRVAPVDLSALGQLPVGTLGRAYAEHMRGAGLDPADIPQRPANTVGEYASAHFYETHDIWHVATGFGVDVPGELGLQGFYAAQLPSRGSALLIAGGLLNSALLRNDVLERDRLFEAIVRGWLLGRRARPLFGIDWDKRWSRPVAELRAEYGIEPPAVDGCLTERWDGRAFSGDRSDRRVSQPAA